MKNKNIKAKSMILLGGLGILAIFIFTVIENISYSDFNIRDFFLMWNSTIEDENSTTNDYSERFIILNGTFKLPESTLKDKEYNIQTNGFALERVAEEYNYNNTKTLEWVVSTNVNYNNNFIFINLNDFKLNGYSLNQKEDYINIFKYNYLSKNRELIKDINKAYVPNGWKISGSYITNSKDINNPQIGDLRISFYKYNQTNNYYTCFGYIDNHGLIISDFMSFKTLEESKEYLNILKRFNIENRRFLMVIIIILIICPIICFNLLIFGIFKLKNIQIKTKQKILISLLLSISLTLFLIAINNIITGIFLDFLIYLGLSLLFGFLGYYIYKRIIKKIDY